MDFANQGEIFITHGDLVEITVDAVVIPTRVEQLGRLAPAFRERFPDFASRYHQARREHPVPQEGLRAGRAFWIPLCDEREAAEWERTTGPRPPFGVAAVQVFDIQTKKPSDWTADHPAYRAASGAICAAAEALQALRAYLPGGAERRFLLAVPALRMGGGDRATPLPAARLQIQAARAALAVYPGLDIVFVTYTPDIYEVYLEARRRERAAPAVDAADLPPAWDQLTAASASSLSGPECPATPASRAIRNSSSGWP